MRPFLLFTLLLLICALLNAQNNWTRKAHNSKQPLQLGFHNYITLPYNSPVDSITTTKGIIEKESKTSYQLYNLPVRDSLCTLFYWDNGLIVEQHTLGIQPLEPPQVFYIGSRGGSMPTAQIKAGQGINGYTPLGGCSLNILICSYTVTRYGADGSVTSAQSFGPAFSTEAKCIMQMAKSGDKFTFSDIKLTDYTNSFKHHPAFTITAK